MVYTIGLVFVVLVIVISIDDFLWDSFYFLRKTLSSHKKTVINVEDIESAPPKMLAVMVAAYHEENVLYDVISNIILSNQYPQSMLHIFLGVYPNDQPTLDVAQALEDKFNNVHRVIHVLDGPSSKADNLNNIIDNIRMFETKHHVSFAGVIVHDSEDLVHPYEFKLENYLLNHHDAIQIPVFPLQMMPKVSNVFKNMISGTYADEFAENHYRMLVTRSETNAFVPSAGTGFVLSKKILDEFKEKDIFPVGSLTEDYKLSLLLKEMGYSVHYALENVERVKNDGHVVQEFISTRSMFPATYQTAIKQKTRWIYGITIQSFQFKDIFKKSRLNVQSRYSLYKDWKAKFGNLLLGPGYLIFAYFIASFFLDIPILYPKYTFSWYLMLVLTLLMIQRQVLRFLAVKNVYGYKSAMISSLFPPLLPLRMVLGNIINFHATFKEWMMYFKKPTKKKATKTPAWSKTDHEFLKEEILQRFRRNLGDTLLYKGLINFVQLKKALSYAADKHIKLGYALFDLGYVSEENIIIAVCEINQWLYLDMQPGCLLDAFDYSKESLLEINAVPIFKIDDYMVVLTTLDADKQTIKSALSAQNIFYVYASKQRVHAIINNMNQQLACIQNTNTIEQYIKQGLISLEQGLLALKYTLNNDPVLSTLHAMGLAIN